MALCECEKDLKTAGGIDWIPKSNGSDLQDQFSYDVRLYYDRTPWELVIVLFVEYEGGVARRLGLGEIRKDEWRAANLKEDFVHLI